MGCEAHLERDNHGGLGVFRTLKVKGLPMNYLRKKWLSHIIMGSTQFEFLIVVQIVTIKLE